MYSMYFDGSSNNAGIGFACIIKDCDGNIIIEETRRIDHKELTSNNAEYLALILGLLTALEHSILELNIYGDSALIINQVLGNYAVKAPHLQAYNFIVQSLLKNFNEINLSWISRDNNSETDRISR